MTTKEEKQVKQILSKLTLTEKAGLLLTLISQGKSKAGAKLRDCLQGKCEPQVFVVG